jgi:hypothetical protein
LHGVNFFLQRIELAKTIEYLLDIRGAIARWSYDVAGNGDPANWSTGANHLAPGPEQQNAAGNFDKGCKITEPLPQPDPIEFRDHHRHPGQLCECGSDETTAKMILRPTRAMAVKFFGCFDTAVTDIFSPVESGGRTKL